MNEEVSDVEDDKFKVRSEIDALVEKSDDKTPRRGRPRKHLASTASSSSSKRQVRDASSTGSAAIDEGETEPKKKRQGSVDVDWDEEIDALTLTQQRRIRKKPKLYSDESSARDEQQRQMSLARKKQRPPKPRQPLTPPWRHPQIQKTSPQSQKEVRELTEQITQVLFEIDNPQKARDRVFLLLKKADFAAAFTKFAPKPGYLNQNKLHQLVEQVVRDLAYSSAGFTLFVESLQVEHCLAVLDVVDQMFELGEDYKLGKALRFWWNSLPFPSRRRWEVVARQNYLRNVKIKANLAPCKHEVSFIQPEEKQRDLEKRWDKIRSESGGMNRLTLPAHSIPCPLCEKEAEKEDRTVMHSLTEVQEHFVASHFQVHGYACHFCGQMYHTLEDLSSNHHDAGCQDWTTWFGGKLLSGDGAEKIDMTHCRLLICCADCGWNTALTRNNPRLDGKGTMNLLQSTMAHHHNEGLLSMVVYYPGQPSENATTIRFATVLRAGGPILKLCGICDNVEFRDPQEANEHYQKEHKETAMKCKVCGEIAATEYVYRQHMLTHVHDRSQMYLADWLSFTARIMPPATNMSCAPRCGWREREDGMHAVGGIRAKISPTKATQLVHPTEHAVGRKIRLMKKRKEEGMMEMVEDGYEFLSIEKETDAAKETRERLKKKYASCDGICEIDDSCWFKPEDAAKFDDWMKYWESKEGQAEGGPPRSMEINMSQEVVEIPEVMVELNFESVDVISGYLLNDDVSYCLECDTILKGAQIKEHLKLDQDSKNKCIVAGPNGAMADRLHPLFTFGLSLPSSSLLCPLCTASACSITGLRLHALTQHGRFVDYTPVERENVTEMESFECDPRSPLARKIDEKLQMPGSGILQSKLSVTPFDIKQETWSMMVNTMSNNSRETVEQFRRFLQMDDATKASTVRMRQSNQPMAGYRPNPVAYRLPGGQHQQMISRGNPIHHPGASRPVQHVQPLQQNGGEVTMRGVSSMAAPIHPHYQHLQQPHHPHAQFARSTASYIPPTTMQHPETVGQYASQALHRGGMAMGGMGRGAAGNILNVSAALERPVLPVNGGAVRKGVEMRMKMMTITTDGLRTFYRCQICSNIAFNTISSFKAHCLRLHFNACGQCNRYYVNDDACKKHVHTCKASNKDNNPNTIMLDARIRHFKSKCMKCSMVIPMAQMVYHLIDDHLEELDFGVDMGMIDVALKRVYNSSAVTGKKKYQLIEELKNVKRQFKYYVLSEKTSQQRDCIVCGLVLPDENTLRAHLTHHKEALNYCFVCPREMASDLRDATSIIIHMRQYHSAAVDGKKLCPICRKFTGQRCPLHLIYECEGNMRCVLCADMPLFATESEMKEHREIVHPAELRRFECSSCASPFSNANDFSRHLCNSRIMRTICNCGHESDSRDSFEHHYITTHVKGGVCKICNIKYSEVELRNHVKNHGKPARSKEARHILINVFERGCREEEDLLAFVSTKSIEAYNLQQAARGTGDSSAPVELSDDEDGVEVVSVSSPASRQAAAAAAHLSQHDHEQAEQTESGSAEDAGVDAATMEAMEMNGSDGGIMQPADSPAPPTLPSAAADDDDDDCVMIDSPATNSRDGAGLSANVREEKEDCTVGGLNEPGYNEEDEDAAGTPVQAVVREFTPDGDDELAVVAEVDNAGYSNAAATLSKQREKKHGCDKCSLRFITSTALQQHMTSSHDLDAGANTCIEDYGIPRDTLLWVCRPCCLAFCNQAKALQHRQGHKGSQIYSCDTCSGYAYNREVLRMHKSKQESKHVSYICPDCRLVFACETSLYEHNASMHQTQLFYLCKGCEVGSTDGLAMYQHCLDCKASRVAFPGTMFSLDTLSVFLGCFPASILHYQPPNPAMFKAYLIKNAARYIVPSLCNHRTLLVANDRAVSCKEHECRSVFNIISYLAMHENGDAVRLLNSVRPAVQTIPYRGLIESVRMMTGMMRASGVNPMMQQHPQYMQRAYSHAAPNRMAGDQLRYPVQVASFGQNPQQQQFQHQQQIGGGGGSPYQRASTTQRNEVRQTEARHDAAMQAARAAMSGGGRLIRPPIAQQQFSAGSMAMQRGGGGQMTFNQFPHCPPPSAPVPPPPRQEVSMMSSIQALVQNVGREGGGVGQAGETSVAGGSTGQCRICSGSMTSRIEEMLHSLHLPTAAQFVCTACPVILQDETQAVIHLSDHFSSSERFVDFDLDCPFRDCTFQPVDLMALRKHVADEHRKICKHKNEFSKTMQCKMTFASKAAADKHRILHEESFAKHGVERSCCLLCGIVDPWMQQINVGGQEFKACHYMIHSAHATKYCRICMKGFKSFGLLVNHYIMKHTESFTSNNDRMCSYCKGVRLPAEKDIEKHCAEFHMVTELEVPKKLRTRVPPEFNEVLGIPYKD